MNFNLNTNEDWLIFSDYLEENNQLDKADFIRNQLDDIEPSWDYEWRRGVGAVGGSFVGVGGSFVGSFVGVGAVGGGIVGVGGEVVGVGGGILGVSLGHEFSY